MLRKAELEGLVAPAEAVLGRAFGDRGADRVGEEHEADGEALAGWVAPSLVVARHVADAEAMPRGHGAAVQLEHPEPEPA